MRLYFWFLSPSTVDKSENVPFVAILANQSNTAQTVCVGPAQSLRVVRQALTLVDEAGRRYTYHGVLYKMGFRRSAFRELGPGQVVGCTGRLHLSDWSLVSGHTYRAQLRLGFETGSEFGLQAWTGPVEAPSVTLRVR